jgi:sRNA-binding carbon storage regulator CsrA
VLGVKGKAPKNVPVHREEIFERIKRERGLLHE